MAIDPSGAMTGRIQQVYDYPSLNLFFITGQATGTPRFDGLGERKASIACVTYNELDSTAFQTMKDQSVQGDSHVTVLINNQQKRVLFYDQFTQVTSYCAFDRLDAEVQQRLNRPARGPTLSM